MTKGEDVRISILEDVEFIIDCLRESEKKRIEIRTPDYGITGEIEDGLIEFKIREY